MMGRIHADIFFQDHYVLNEVGVKIKLIRSNDAFCLMGDATYKAKIMHASLFVRKAKLMPSVFLAHAKALERRTSKYPIQRMVWKSFTIPTVIWTSTTRNFSGQLPTCMVIVLVDNGAFNGNRALNPFDFQHFILSEIGLYLDGQQQHAVMPIQPNFMNEHYIRAYNTVFVGTG